MQQTDDKSRKGAVVVGRTNVESLIRRREECVLIKACVVHAALLARRNRCYCVDIAANSPSFVHQCKNWPVEAIGHLLV